MTHSYQDRQRQLDERAGELAQEHPYLVHRATQTKAKPGWVSANVRKLFQHLWPDIPCSTRIERWANGMSIELIYLTVPGAPDSSEVLGKLKDFQSQRYNSEDETFDFDTDFEREAFRKAFGGTSKVYAVAKQPSPEQLSRHLRKALPKGDNSPRKPRF